MWKKVNYKNSVDFYDSTFYLCSNIKLLEEFGLEVVYFSPVKDTKLPENVQVLYIGACYLDFRAIYGLLNEIAPHMFLLIKEFS